MNSYTAPLSRHHRALALLLTVALVCTCLFAWAPAQASNERFSDGMLRVRLTSAGYTGNIQLKPYGNYTIAEAPGVTLQKDSVYVVSLAGDGVGLYQNGTLLYSGSRITFARGADNDLTGLLGILNSPYWGEEMRYLGDMTFTKSNLLGSTGWLCCVNIIHIDLYLLGVLYKEISPDYYPQESVTAHAITSRTYAMFYAVCHDYGEFSVCDTTTHQVYGGFPYREYASRDQTCWNRMVTAIWGSEQQVLENANGQIIEAAFSSSNGGETLTYEGAWGGGTGARYAFSTCREDPYDAEYCRRYSSLRSESYLSKDASQWPSDVYAMLKDKVADAAGNSNITVTGIANIVGADTRNQGILRLFQNWDFTLNYTTSSGTAGSKTVRVTGRNFVGLTGYCKNRAVALRITENGDGYNVEHTRSGHGVGLSQYGARVMAEKGWTHQQILGFYFNKGVYLGTQNYTKCDLENIIVPPSSSVTPTVTPSGELPEPIYLGTVVGESVNVRTGPGTEYEKIGSLQVGTQVSVTAIDGNGSWYQILYNNAVYYVHKDYIELSALPTATPTVTPTATPTATASTGIDLPPVIAQGTVVNVKTSVNVRAEANTASALLGQLLLGATVDVTQQQYEGKDWHQILFNGQVGYIHKDYVSLQSGTTSPAATATPAATPVVTPTPTVTATATATGTPVSTHTLMDAVVVNVKEYVMVRSQPSETSTALGKLNLGAFAVVTQAYYTPTWHQVQYQGSTAYVYAYYLSIQEDDAPVAPVVISAQNGLVGIVSGAPSAYVYAAPGNTLAILGALSAGNVVSVTKQNVSAGWHQVRYAGYTGYMQSRYLSLYSMVD